jgi:hypothetical protein
MNTVEIAILVPNSRILIKPRIIYDFKLLAGYFRNEGPVQI